MRVPIIRTVRTIESIYTQLPVADTHQSCVNLLVEAIITAIKVKASNNDLSSVEVYIENKVEDSTYDTIITFMVPLSQYELLANAIRNA